jgi:hypothetical protein
VDHQVEVFLRSIAEVARDHEGVLAGETIIPLVHPFWSFDQIIKAREIQAEWDVPADLIGFYGNWHSLICLSQSTREVLFLDDDRNTVHQWSSMAAFQNCLRTVAEHQGSAPGDLGVIEDGTWFDL